MKFYFFTQKQTIGNVLECDTAKLLLMELIIVIVWAWVTKTKNY